MKPVVVFVLTFVVATAASTGAKVVMTKPPVKTAADFAHADSTRADSTHAEHADSAKSVTDTAIVASGAPVIPPSDTARAPNAAPVPAAAAAAPVPAATPAPV